MTRNIEHNNGIAFLKMHGLGNDFVIIDARGIESPVSEALAKGIADRHFGVGYDQLAVLSEADDADVAITFWNADGSLAQACGNASRCIAQLLVNETGKNALVLKTANGLLPAKVTPTGEISVNMGQPVLDWRKIPLSEDVDITSLPIDGAPAAVSMGNPHCIFVVDDVMAIDLAKKGSEIEHHPLFPERTNVEFIEIKDKTHIRQRTWERGAGETLACGSGACAVVVGAARKELCERAAFVELDGGTLHIDWRDDGVWMTGPTALVFEGHLSADFLAGL